MSKYFSVVSLLFVFILCTSCFKDQDDLSDINDFSIIGAWELTTWTIQIPMDLNNDAISSTNLLDEALCDNNETLTFDTNGTVSSDRSYNPQVTISVVNGTIDNYTFDVVCDTDGSIGANGTYTQNNNSIALFETTATISGNLLTIVYLDAIEIYNEALTDVLETKDLTLVYTKK